MISVAEARAHLSALVSPLTTEHVTLSQAAGRVLAQPVAATRDQPPFAASAMDGYALKAIEAERHAQFKLVGESAAGHGWNGTLKAGQSVRIFTGAPVPQGADFVVIQEDTDATGNLITIVNEPGSKPNIRPAGADFTAGSTLDAPRLLSPSDIALLASMNISQVPVTRKPVVALLATGDELVMPGESPSADQIIASNSFGLQALLRDLGAAPRLLPIARDNMASLDMAFELAQDADLIVTIGGASVGDHDLVAQAAAQRGLKQSFYKVAMRPGKPLMAGQLNGTAMIGLPGNPVSAMVCGHVFLAPVIRLMLGLSDPFPAPQMAPLSMDLPANGPREHYMRAQLTEGKIQAFDRQDSALLGVLSQANALLIRPPKAPEAKTGTLVPYLPL